MIRCSSLADQLIAFASLGRKEISVKDEGVGFLIMGDYKKYFCLLLTSFTIFLAMAVFFPVAKASAQASGYWDSYTAEVTENNGVYEISSAEQLAWIASLVNSDAGNGLAGKTIKLMNDIDLSAHHWKPIGHQVSYFYNYFFKGTFDGNGKTISGLTIGTVEEPFGVYHGYYYFGLFGQVSEGAVIKDLSLENVGLYSHNTSTYNAYYYVGALVGLIINYSSSPVMISNCSATGEVKALGINSTAGGLVGDMTQTIISNSYTEATISGSSDKDNKKIGGLAGNASNSKIYNCYAISNLSAGNAAYIGGLIGYSSNTKIYNSYARGDITSTATPASKSSILGLGGFTGQIYSGEIHNCYASTNISASANGTGLTVMGGFTAISYQNSQPVYDNAYWNNSANYMKNGETYTSITGDGYLSGDNYLIGKSTAEMTDEAFLNTLNTGNDTITGAADWKFMTGSNDGFPMLNGVNDKAKYTVTFNSQGGTQVDSQTVNEGDTVDEPQAPTKEYCEFAGWYIDDTYATAWDFANDTVSGNLTLYAKWVVEKHVVRFDSQGGIAILVQSVVSGSTIDRPADPEKEGFELSGWYEDLDCSDKWDFDIDLVAADMVLYAGWVKGSGVSISGKITAQDTGLGVNGVNVSLIFQESAAASQYGYTSGQVVKLVKTDDFGYYRFNYVKPGTYTLKAEHPAYQPGEETDFIIGQESRSWDKALVPDETAQNTIDIYVEVGCVTSGIPLQYVPVAVTVTKSFDQTTVDYSSYTDYYGMVHFPGMPKGFYSFNINQGNDKRGGWEGYSTSVSEEITAPQWVDCKLKPEYRELMVSVYGYDPIKDLPDQMLGGITVEATGLDPRDDVTELIPPQVGVTGIKKEAGDNGYANWDNTMAGKVKFEKLIPIDWRVDTKRMGYIPATDYVYADADGNLTETNIRMDIALEPTKLKVELNTPYNDPEMLKGLEVELAGLESSNTEGILRKVKAEYDQTEAIAYALFENILPGDYRLAVKDTVKKTVPVLINGTELYDGSNWASRSKTFEINFNGTAVAYAGVGITTEVALDLEAEKMKLKGTLYAVDEQNTNVENYEEYLHYVVSGKEVEIHASEYYSDHMPDSDQVYRFTTNASGEFEVELYPGLYGVVVNDMDDYWGNSVEFSNGSYTGWPYYQEWPYSLASARAYMSRGESDPMADLAGMALSSGEELTASFFTRKNWFNASITCDIGVKNPTASQVTAIDRTDPLYPVIKTIGYDDLRNIEDGGTLILSGPVSKSIQLATEEPLFTELTPGSYSASIIHPRYSAAQNASFTFFDFPSPGTLPAEEFPADYNSDGNPWPMLPWYPDALSCEMQGAIKVSDAIDVTVYRLDEGTGEYVSAGIAYPSFIKTRYTGERIFQITYSDDYVPNSEYDAYFYWKPRSGPFSDGDNPKEHWFMLTSDDSGCIVGGGIYIGSTPEVAPLDIAYTLDIVALDTDNRNGMPISGVTVTFSDGESLASGQTYEDQTRKLEVTNAVLNPWNWPGADRGFETEIDYSTDVPKVKLTIYMEKSVNVRGTVVNSVTGNPVEGVQWKLLKAFGNEAILMGENQATLANGEFAQRWPLENRVYFLEFAAAGYEPCRVRLDPGDAVDDPYSSEEGLLAHVLSGEKAVRLNPLKKPVIQTNTLEMDRFGTFIPGIKKAGNQQTFLLTSNSEVEERLTMNYAIQANLPESNYTIERPKYDTASGSAGNEEISLNDEIAEFWLIDRKAFTDKTFKDTPTAVEVPSTEDSQYDPQKLHRWLQAIKGGETSELKNIYYQRLDVKSIAPGENGVKKLAGQVHLWELPPDDFRPTFVVVTKLGAVEVFNFDYMNDKDKISNLPSPFTTDPTLVGMRLPEWFASYIDVMSYGAKATSLFGDAAKEKVQKATPMGRIVPLPSFTADIELRADKCLNYVYRLDVGMVQGSKTPSSDMLSVGPGMMGFELAGALETTLKGPDKEFYIQSEATLSKTNIDTKSLTPKILDNIGAAVELDPGPTGSYYHIDDYFFNKTNQPTEKAVVNGVSGQVGMKARASIFERLKYVPKVGWVLLALQKTGALDVGMFTKGLIGVRGLYGYKTIFPQNVEHQTSEDTGYIIITDGTGTVYRQPVRSFMGGLETDNVIAASEKAQNLTTEEKEAMGITETNTSSLDICVNFGVGLDVKALGGRMGAEGTIEVAGDDSWTKKPALFIIVNTNGFSPVISQIKGDIRATTDIYVKAWIAKMQKHYIWGKIPIDLKFTTESTFELIPMGVTIEETNREDYGISTFNGSPETIVDNFLEIGDYSSDSTGSGAIAYTDMETMGGDMRLMASGYSSRNTWGSPGCISKTAGAIVSHDIIKLPGSDTYMAVWSEITAADVDKTCPSSTLKYSQGNLVDGAWDWTVPATCANLDGVATHIELLPNGDQISLVYMSTDEGPQGVNYQVSGLNWNGSSWDAAVKLIDRSRISGFSSCGTNDPVVSPIRIAYVDDEQNLKTLSWTSNGVSAETLLEEECGNDLAMVNDSDGRTYLAYSIPGQGIGLYSYASGQWYDQGIPFAAALPNQLDMELLPGGELLLGWTDISGDYAAYGIVSQDGMVISDGRTLTSENSGKYYGVSLVEAGSDSDETVYLFALNENEEVSLNATVIRTEEDECFIATAAFGSKFSWPVTLLRQFRDQYLLTNDMGKSLVRFYYNNSPPLADYIAGSEGLRLLVRILLVPVIALVYLLYHPLWAVLALGVGLLLLFKKKKVIETGI